MTRAWCSAVLLALATSAQPQQPIDVYDGFDAPALSKLWETSRFTDGALRFQSRIVRAGRGAAEITVRTGDKFEAGAGGNSDSERAELMESRTLVSKERSPYEYSFSLFFPETFPIVPTRLVVAQWKQYCAEGRACWDDSPVLAIRYMSDTLRITQDIGKKSIVLREEKGGFRGRWLDFKVQARFSTGDDGEVRVWLDGRSLVNFHGVTANAMTETSGYKSPGYFYFKMGLYRNVMAEPMTVFIDEYRKKELQAN